LHQAVFRIRRLALAAAHGEPLERIVRASSSEVQMSERARIVLAAGEGLTTEQIARRVGRSERTVKKWRPRYERRGAARRAQVRGAADARSPDQGAADRQGVHPARADRGGRAAGTLDV